MGLLSRERRAVIHPRGAEPPSGTCDTWHHTGRCRGDCQLHGEAVTLGGPLAPVTRGKGGEDTWQEGRSGSDGQCLQSITAWKCEQWGMEDVCEA